MTSNINIEIKFNDFLALIGKEKTRISEFLRKHPSFPHSNPNARVYTVNLIEAMLYWNQYKGDPKKEYQEELCRKVKLEADLLQTKIDLSNKLLVDPVLALSQIQRDYAEVKDKLINQKILLINDCENKSLAELEAVFDKHTENTLQLLSSESKMNRLLKEET